MSNEPLNVLVLCTGNSARSILGEALFNARSAGRIHAFSAGSHPTGRVNPAALAKLAREGLPTDGLASKSWDRYAEPGAPKLHIVITVCDSAAGEACPVWFGSPVRVHWGIPDPAGAEDEEAAFDTAFRQLENRIDRALELPLEDLGARKRQESLQGIHDAVSRDEAAQGAEAR